MNEKNILQTNELRISDVTMKQSGNKCGVLAQAQADLPSNLPVCISVTPEDNPSFLIDVKILYDVIPC